MGLKILTKKDIRRTLLIKKNWNAKETGYLLMNKKYGLGKTPYKPMKNPHYTTKERIYFGGFLGLYKKF